jgi:hypothetical protein
VRWELSSHNELAAPKKRGRFSFARKKKVFTNQFTTLRAWMLKKQSGFSFLRSLAARLCTPWP